MSKGIDYSNGRANIDHDTGIRYGVISQHAMGEGFYDAQEMDYGTAHCPKCGNDAVDSGDDSIPPTDERTDWEYKGNDYACLACQYTFWSDEAFSDEAIGWTIDADGYQCGDCLDSDVFVFKAPYYTHAVFCSPCVPGACSLESPHADGAKAYCFGHDWFDGGKAPYPVYSVETGLLVTPEVQS